MSLTFGTGLFWILLAMTVGEQAVAYAKVRAAKAEPDPDVPALKRRIAELERRLEEQVDAFQSHQDAMHRLEESTEFMERLIGSRDVKPSNALDEPKK